MRADKYDKKLKINADFEDALKASMGGDDKFKKEVEYYANIKTASFILDSKNLLYPASFHQIYSKQFSHLKVIGECKNGSVTITYSVGGLKHREVLHINPMTHIIEYDEKIPFYGCNIKFELVPIEDSAKSNLEFQLY